MDSRRESLARSGSIASSSQRSSVVSDGGTAAAAAAGRVAGREARGPVRYAVTPTWSNTIPHKARGCGRAKHTHTHEAGVDRERARQPARHATPLPRRCLPHATRLLLRGGRLLHHPRRAALRALLRAYIHTDLPLACSHVRR